MDNYNRLACLPQPAWRHRLQALDEFPPLVSALLLDGYHRPDLFGTDEDEPARRAIILVAVGHPVLDAMDRGRDLIGALASAFRVDRALVRSPVCRESWTCGAATRSRLALLHAIPAHARPHSAASAEEGLDLLDALPIPRRSQMCRKPLAHSFSAGWDDVWARWRDEFPVLLHSLRDTRDFLRAALQQADPAWLPPGWGMGGLALHWVMRRGLESLLRASHRWHAQPLTADADVTGLPDDVMAIVGVVEDTGDRAIELVTRAALRAEGEAMYHCIGSYWDECVLCPARAVHLERADGERATAWYEWDGDHETPRLLDAGTELRAAVDDVRDDDA